MLKRMLCTALALLLALGVLACGAPAGEPRGEPGPEVVAFSDAVLEARVREAMGKPEGDVTVAEAKAVTKLDLSNEFQQDIPDDVKIKDIGALKYFTNLTELNLSFHSVADISVLSRLTKLTYLDFYSNNTVVDISPLANLTNLSVLNLQYNQVQDVGSLANLASLTALFLKGNPIADYGPLQDIYPNLAERDFELLSADSVSDEPIAFADPNLEAAVRRALGIADRPVTQRDAYPVQSLGLNTVPGSDEVFSNLTGLEYFVNVEILSLDGNQITDLGPIGAMTKMKSLVIADNQIVDLSPLATMGQLEVLDARNNAINDVSPLAGLTGIWELQLGGNSIVDVAPLASLTKLTALFLGENDIADYSPLKDIYPQLKDKDFELN